MKYSDLISFHPIEDVIQLVTADDKNKAREYVKTYVMSDTMAESLQAPVIDQLQMDEVVDNKGVLIVPLHLLIGKEMVTLKRKFAEQVEFVGWVGRIKRQREGMDIASVEME